MDPTAVRRWQPASHDVNVRAPYYFIGVASRECWDCDTGSRVHGFILPPGLQTFYVGDEPEDDRWESSEEPSLVCYLAYLHPCVAVRIKARIRHYRIGYRDTTKSFYWMNFCEHCGAKLGDFETFCEPGQGCLPATAAQATLITLTKIDETFAAHPGCYSTGIELFAQMRQR